MQGRAVKDNEKKNEKNLNAVLKEVFEMCEEAMEDSLKTLGLIGFVEKGKEQAYENGIVAEITKKYNEKAKTDRSFLSLMLQSKELGRGLDSVNHSEATTEIAKFKASIRYVGSKRIPNLLVLKKQNTSELDRLYMERIINICLIRTEIIELKKDAAGRANIADPDFNNFIDKAFTLIKLLQEKETPFLRANAMFADFPPSFCVAICNTELTKARVNQARNVQRV